MLQRDQAQVAAVDQLTCDDAGDVDVEMCSNETPAETTTTPLSPVIPSMVLATTPRVAPTGLLPIDQYRFQLYQYAVAERMWYPLLGPFIAAAPVPCYQLFPSVLLPEEPKPQHTYIGLIAMAILSAPDGKLVLSDIYQHILDHYPYFRKCGPGWRNSIRHNLSTNDCFVQAGRSVNGKCHYWAIHSANVEDFRKGDFRRRPAQRKHIAKNKIGGDSPLPVQPEPATAFITVAAPVGVAVDGGFCQRGTSRKRQFDVASLLAPDPGHETGNKDIVEANSDQQQQEPEEAVTATAAVRSWPIFSIVNYYQSLLQSQPSDDSPHTEEY